MVMIKDRLKRILKPILAKLDLLADYKYDYIRYSDYSLKNGVPSNNRQLKFRLLQRAHSFEKALSLPAVRPLFGKDKLMELVRLIEWYEKSGLPKDGTEYKMAVSSFNSYVEFHKQQSIDIYHEFIFLKDFVVDTPPSIGSSVKLMKAEDILLRAKGDFEQLSASRVSSRQFSAIPVDIELIVEAVKLAQKSPSVCNRQSAHVFLVDNEELKSKALKIQAGNSGFGQEISKLLIVTASLESFDGSKERNQGFIDGGLFAMSLMYALHYKGLATCPLNWSSGRKKDQRLRKLLAIPEEHVVIMLMAVGHHKEEYNIAVSPRRSVTDVFGIID